MDVSTWSRVFGQLRFWANILPKSPCDFQRECGQHSTCTACFSCPLRNEKDSDDYLEETSRQSVYWGEPLDSVLSNTENSDVSHIQKSYCHLFRHCIDQWIRSECTERSGWRVLPPATLLLQDGHKVGQQDSAVRAAGRDAQAVWNTLLRLEDLLQNNQGSRDLPGQGLLLIHQICSAWCIVV